MTKRIVIATMTHDGKGSARLQEEALDILSKKNYTVYISDGGSSEIFVKRLKKMGHKVSIALEGLASQHKDTIIRASHNGKIVLYTEPDKYDWFKEGLEETIQLYLQDQKSFANVGRTTQKIKTFPRDQQKWEMKTNKLVEKVINLKGDFAYGPKLFPSKLGYQIKEIPNTLGWGALMFLVGRAHKQKIEIKTIYTAAPCPTSQRKENNHDYRKRQYFEGLNGFFLGLV